MENSKKKDWAKNAIIVFLIIMLLLTLFSNTITNYTLPQVSVAYVTNGNITESIRGSGTVEVDDQFTLKATETREIESVKFAKGDHVEKGDVIFVLSPIESDELLKAEGELDDLKIKYYKSLLTANMSVDAAKSVKKNGASSFETYMNKLAEIDAKIEETKALITEKQTLVSNIGMASKIETTKQIGSLDAYSLEKELAATAKSDAEAAFNDAKSRTTNALDVEIQSIETTISQITTASSSSELTRAKNDLVAILDAICYASGGTNNTPYCDSTYSAIDKIEIESATYLVLKNIYDYFYDLVGTKTE